MTGKHLLVMLLLQTKFSFAFSVGGFEKVESVRS
jgi:hypothetical protein